MRDHHHDGQGLRRLLVSAATTVLLLFANTTSATLQATQEGKDGAKQAVVTVEGMQCPFCAYGIKKHLAKIPGVARVEVELAKNQAVVTLESGAQVDDEDIQRAVRKAGFTPGRIEWQPAAREGS